MKRNGFGAWLAACVSVALGFALVIGCGLRAGDRLATIDARVAGALAALGILAVSIASFAMFRAAFGLRFAPRPLRRRRVVRRAEVAETRTRASRMAGRWNEAARVYDGDPSATRTCEHLRGLEAAMRGGGVRVSIVSLEPASAHVRARCVIDEPRLRAAFEVADSVRYLERFEADERGYPLPVARLLCELTSSSIETVHPADDDGTANVPRFP